VQKTRTTATARARARAEADSFASLRNDRQKGKCKNKITATAEQKDFLVHWDHNAGDSRCGAEEGAEIAGVGLKKFPQWLKAVPLSKTDFFSSF
jgi:hypothetical protein